MTPTVTQRLVTYKTAGWALLIALVGAGLLWLSNLAWFDARPAGEATLNQLGGLLITTGVLGVLWDLRGKRDIMDEILEKVRLAADVRAAGLQRVTMNWLDVPWEDLFGDAGTVEVFISYGSSWRKVHWPKLREFAKEKKHTLRIYLPDPRDEATMKVLAMRYSYTPEKVKANVIETAAELAQLGKDNPADIRIYYRVGDPTYTSYRFDTRVVVTMYSNKRLRGDIPTMIVGQGTFYDFFLADLEAIRSQSEEMAQDKLLAEMGIK